jgi:hypothetical protein
MITVGFVIAVVWQLMPAGGVLFFKTDNDIATKEAKKKWWKGTIGMSLLLGVGLLSYVNPSYGKIVLPKDFSLSSLQNTNTNPNPDTSTTDEEEDEEEDTGPLAPPPSTGNANLDLMLQDEANARTRLSQMGISVNRSPCTQVKQTGCTSVGGMAERTFTMLQKLKNGCNCSLTVSGGTEWWLHGDPKDDTGASTRHKPGGGAVDLSLNDNITSFLSKSGQKADPGKRCSAKFRYEGFSFCNEICTGKCSAAHYHAE